MKYIRISPSNFEKLLLDITKSKNLLPPKMIGDEPFFEEEGLSVSDLDAEQLERLANALRVNTRLVSLKFHDGFSALDPFSFFGFFHQNLSLREVIFTPAAEYALERQLKITHEDKGADREGSNIDFQCLKYTINNYICRNLRVYRMVRDLKSKVLRYNTSLRELKRSLKLPKSPFNGSSFFSVDPVPLLRVARDHIRSMKADYRQLDDGGLQYLQWLI